jgi:thiamine pyrophosphokinase
MCLPSKSCGKIVNNKTFLTFNPTTCCLLSRPQAPADTPSASLRVAADGGANRLLDVVENDADGGLFVRRPPPRHAANPSRKTSPPSIAVLTLAQDNLEAIVGDLDSLTAQARQHFTTTAKPAKVIHDPEQYSTDFGKAVRWVRASSSSAAAADPPVDIVAMGGLGGRVDQGLSQLHHLYLFQTSPSYAEGRLFLVSGESVTFLLKAGRHRIHVREEGRSDVFDKYAGIVPVKEPSVITLRGFEWDVTDWETEFGGQMSTSNHVLPEVEAVEVETTRDVLFTIALKR